MNQLGYFGKTPHQGDFVRFNLPKTFVKVWDDWLQQFMIYGESLGDAWPDLYAKAPTYQFVLSNGIAGSTPWVGALRASQDKVGRRFPFCIAMSLPEDALPCVSAIRTKTLFDELNALLDRVMNKGYSFDQLKGELALIADTHAQEPANDISLISLNNSNTSGAIAIGMENSSAFHSAEALPAVLDSVLQQTLGEYSLWFAHGTTEATVITSGLPVDAAGLALVNSKFRKTSTAFLDLSGLMIKSEQTNQSTQLSAAALATDHVAEEPPELSTSDVADDTDHARKESRGPQNDKSVDMQKVVELESASAEHTPSSNDWAAFDHFAETPEIIGNVIVPKVEPLELEDDDFLDEPWEK